MSNITDAEILAFIEEFGRVPSLADLMMIQEAKASIALDNDLNYPQTLKKDSE